MPGGGGISDTWRGRHILRGGEEGYQILRGGGG
jgi:hypothetical protein